MNQVARDFSYAAERYDVHAALQMHVLERAAKQFSGLVSPGEAVLDVGCGTGALARHLTNPIVGCDIAEGMCRQTSFPSLCADITSLPFEDQLFKSIFSSLALQWLEEKPLALAEMQRVCGPEGKALVTTLGPTTLQELRALDVPTLSFLDEETYVLFANQAGWHVEKSSTEMVEWNYDTLLDLLRSIKAIGARHKHRRGYLRKSELMQPITATWEVITLQLEKPAE